VVGLYERRVPALHAGGGRRLKRSTTRSSTRSTPATSSTSGEVLEQLDVVDEREVLDHQVLDQVDAGDVVDEREVLLAKRRAKKGPA
jgi:hypothetical protein